MISDRMFNHITSLFTDEYPKVNNYQTMPPFFEYAKETCQVAFLTRMLYFILDAILYMTKIFMTNFIFTLNLDSTYGEDFDATCSSAGYVSSARDHIRLFIWFVLLLVFIYMSIKNKTVHFPTLFILLFSITYKTASGPLFFNPIGKNCALVLNKATNTNIFVNLLVIISSFMTLSFFI